MTYVYTNRNFLILKEACFLKGSLCFARISPSQFILRPHLVTTVGCLTVSTRGFHFCVSIVEKYIILFEILNHLYQQEVKKMMPQSLLLSSSEKRQKAPPFGFAPTSFLLDHQQVFTDNSYLTTPVGFPPTSNFSTMASHVRVFLRIFFMSSK